MCKVESASVDNPTSPEGGAQTPGKMKTNSFFSQRIRLCGLLTVVGYLAAFGTIAGFLGQYAWWMDLGSHFRVQYAILFTFLTIYYALCKKKRWALGALSLAFVNAMPVAMFLLPRAAATSASGASFRAMLINVNTERGDPARVITAITKENPDIVVLEEISDEWVKALDPVLKTYPVRKIEPRNDNFGIGLFTRIPCVSTRVEYLGDAKVPSIFAEIMPDDRKLTLITTHPLPPGGSEYSSCRNEQLDKVAKEAATIQGPVLLLGDLNVTPWSYYYRRFVKTSELHDSAKGRSINPTWPSFFPLLGIQIDHCFHSDEVVISSRRVGRNVGSDHYPLTMDFSLK